MKITITESQFNTINESITKRQDLCLTFGRYSEFCKKIEKNIHLKKDNLISQSTEFFNKVVTNEKFFKTMVLKPGNPDFDNRLDNLIYLKNLLTTYKSCSNIINKIEDDIKTLPEKGLKMVVDEYDKYSLLNRLNTHYSAKAYLLTEIILNELGYENREKTGDIDLNNMSDDNVREIIKFVIDNNHIDKISSYLSNLLKENKEFRDYFMGTLTYSRDKGNEVEKGVFKSLVDKYGKDNVIEFSEDFGFVDYFGIDGIVIDGDTAHPIQVSTSVKGNPKIFKFTSVDENCKPIGFYKIGNRIIQYHPI
jgi:hypothetical protein